MKTKGAIFLLDVEVTTGVFATVAAMKTTTMTISNETVDVTSKGDLQRELLENCGIQSVSIKAQGCISSADSYKKISYAANTGEILNVKINSNNGEIYAGGLKHPYPSQIIPDQRQDIGAVACNPYPSRYQKCQLCHKACCYKGSILLRNQILQKKPGTILLGCAMLTMSTVAWADNQANRMQKRHRQVWKVILTEA